jgi:hypothetical protein
MDSGLVLRTPRNDEGKFHARFLGKRFKFQTFIPQTQLRDLAAHFARVLHKRPALLDQRAQGKPGARCTRSRVRKV